MKIDPFTDTAAFLLGNTPDHEASGALRTPFVTLFAALIVGNAAVAIANWRRDPGRTL